MGGGGNIREHLRLTHCGVGGGRVAILVFCFVFENDNVDTGTIFAESPPVQTCDLPTTCMQRINSGLPPGDIVSNANALLHRSAAASLSGSNDMNTILGALTSVTQCFSNLQETIEVTTERETTVRCKWF